MSFNNRSSQLDLFRGMATVFMVANHAGYQLLGQSADAPGWPASVVFVTSSAPALFFFASGVGAALSGTPENGGSVLRKVVLLLLADAFMNWGGGGWWGLDFFGFAAIATAVLAVVRWSRWPVRLAAGLLAIVVLTRFAIAPIWRDTMADNPVFAFTTGVGYVLGISYPLCPWLAFPLAGFLVGRGLDRQLRLHEGLLAAGLALAGFAASFALVRHGASAFRWGSVSLAYFLFAIGTLALTWLCAAGVAAHPAAWKEPLKLRGPASLMVVPLHYAALAVLSRLLPPPWPFGPWLPVAALVCLAVLLASKRIVAAVGRRLSPPALASDAVVMAFVTAMALGARLGAAPLPRLVIECLAEVAVGLLLARSARRTLALPRYSVSPARS